MDTRAALKANMDMAQMVCMGYLEDLTDEEMMHRPHADCNHIKWQLGHLIASENQLVEGVMPGAMPKLPEGFAERYAKETAKSDDASQFDTKKDLLDLYEQQHPAAEAALAKQSDEDLDRPAPEEMQAYAPTVGAVFNLVGSHWMMHAGQWAVVRRQLGRPPLF